MCSGSVPKKSLRGVEVRSQDPEKPQQVPRAGCVCVAPGRPAGGDRVPGLTNSDVENAGAYTTEGAEFAHCIQLTGSTEIPMLYEGGM